MILKYEIIQQRNDVLAKRKKELIVIEIFFLNNNRFLYITLIFKKINN